MKETPKYKIIKRGNRKSLALRFWDDEIGKWVERSTGVGRRRDALRLVSEIVRLYHESKAPPPEYGHDYSKWPDFRVKYDREKASILATPGVWKSAANLLEKLLNPQETAEVSAAMLSQYQTLLRQRNLKEATIGSYLKHIRAALGWAEELEIIDKAPKVRIPKAAKQGKNMKGRPITTEEFERMLEQFSDEVGKERAEAYKKAANVMWLTGLRLDEALRLSHSDQTQIHLVGLNTRRPLLSFPDTEHKQREDTLVPLTPDAVDYFRRMPESSGLVLNLKTKTGQPTTSSGYVGKVFAAAGESAGVIVEQRSRLTKKGQWLPKYASAHDLRRSFGDRWSHRVMPAVLMQLMRHKSIETTMKYYVGRNTERLANEIWDAFAANSGRAQGDTLGDNSPKDKITKAS